MNCDFEHQITTPNVNENGEHWAPLENPSVQTFRILVTYRPLESDDNKPFTKLAFVFGDRAKIYDSFMFQVNKRWLRAINNMNVFLPQMDSSYRLSYLQHLFVPRHMNWKFVCSVDQMIVGWFGSSDVVSTKVLGLFFGWARMESPRGETTQHDDVFINRFMEVDVDFLNDFCLAG